MIEFLPAFMPEHLQAGLLADHRAIRREDRSEALTRASRWFQGRLKKFEADKPTVRYQDMKRDAFQGFYSSGETNNTDIHTDTPLLPELVHGTKYMLTVASNSRGSTLFFPNAAESLNGWRTEHLFTPDAMGALTLCDGIELEWLQAGNGQICRFDVSTDYHAAAPLYQGDIKVVMSAIYVSETK